MSRGLGKMQRTILENLDASKDWMLSAGSSLMCGVRIATSRYYSHCPEDNNPLVVKIKGHKFGLGEGYYDLMAVLHYLAKRDKKTHVTCNGVLWIDSTLESSLWRAARKLVAGGYLKALHPDSIRLVQRGERLSVADKGVNTYAGGEL